MSEQPLSDREFVPEGFDGPPDPRTVACPTCGADVDEPCVLIGAEGASEPAGRPHSKRMTNSRGGPDA